MRANEHVGQHRINRSLRLSRVGVGRATSTVPSVDQCAPLTHHQPLGAFCEPFSLSASKQDSGLAPMIQSTLSPKEDRIIEPMIALARCSIRHRIVVTGTNSAELMFELHRRGFVRVATTANCPLPDGQYDVALVDGRHKSIKALETTLGWLMDFVDLAGVVVVWIDLPEPSANQKIRSVLEKNGLTVEADTVRDYGAAISARRSAIKSISKLL
jgi:hypothetical protein